MWRPQMFYVRTILLQQKIKPTSLKNAKWWNAKELVKVVNFVLFFSFAMGMRLGRGLLLPSIKLVIKLI